jgi:hypothetical protein
MWFAHLACKKALQLALVRNPHFLTVPNWLRLRLFSIGAATLKFALFPSTISQTMVELEAGGLRSELKCKDPQRREVPAVNFFKASNSRKKMTCCSLRATF